MLYRNFDLFVRFVNYDSQLFAEILYFTAVKTEIIIILCDL